jgi:hypothetical protein
VKPTCPNTSVTDSRTSSRSSKSNPFSFASDTTATRRNGSHCATCTIRMPRRPGSTSHGEIQNSMSGPDGGKRRPLIDRQVRWRRGGLRTWFSGHGERRHKGRPQHQPRRGAHPGWQSPDGIQVHDPYPAVVRGPRVRLHLVHDVCVPAGEAGRRHLETADPKCDL